MNNELYMLTTKIILMILQFVPETGQTCAIDNCDNPFILGYARKQTPKIYKMAIEKNPDAKIFPRIDIDKFQ